MQRSRKDIIGQLQKEILRLQGIKAPVAGEKTAFGLAEIEEAFPNKIFPTGTIHEFLTFEPEHNAASSGFITGLLNTLMKNGGASVWISINRTVYPVSLKAFGIKPDRIIFVDLKREKDILWAAEEALKCSGLSAVITELSEMSFTQSRRLQLAVEQSKVTGFILRKDPLKLTTSASAARWQVTHLPSELETGMPGVGFPRWNVQLLKVRNGYPGSSQIEWQAGKFVPLQQQSIEFQQSQIIRKAV